MPDKFTLQQVIAALGEARSTPKGQRYFCPVCLDWKLVINPGNTQPWIAACFGDCNSSALFAAIVKICKKKNEPAKPVEASSGLTTAQYADAKKLPADYLRNDWHISDTVYQGIAAVKFPYGDSAKFRLGMGKADHRLQKGHKAQLYGLEQLKQLKPADYLFITEGESNTQTLHYNGLCVVGAPGAKHWKPEWADLFKERERIYVTQDPDEAGANFAKAVLASFPGRARAIKFPVKDVSDLWLRAWAEFGWLEEETVRDTFKLWLREACDAPTDAPTKLSTAEVTSNAIKPEEIAHPENEELKDLPENALSGRLGEWCQKNLSAFPRAYAWPAIVTIAGSLVPLTEGRNGDSDYPDEPETEASSHPIFERLNLYTCLVGPVGSGKSQAWEQCMAMFGLTPNDLPILNMRSGSMEGLARKLTGQKLFYVNELGHLLEKAKIENASFTYVLNDLYYGDTIEMTMAKKEVVKLDTRLSIGGGIVDELFGDLFGANTTGGFYDRFIFGICPKPFSYFHSPYEGETHRASSISLNPVAMTPAVREARNEQFKAHPETDRRVYEQALRVAGICAAFNGQREIKETDLPAAWAFAHYQDQCRKMVQPVPGKNQSAQCRNRILNTLQRYYTEGKWLRLVWVKNTSGVLKDFGPDIVNRTLAAMEFNDEVATNKPSDRPRLIRPVNAQQ
jgi:hypothetical protein